jgi:hypothetical protein
VTVEKPRRVRQSDLFGQPDAGAGPRARLGGRGGVSVTQASLDAAEAILAHYVSKVRSVFRANQRCTIAICRRLNAGQKVETLTACIDHYAAFCDGRKQALDMRPPARTFFGPRGDWGDYATPVELPPSASGVSAFDGFAAKVAARCPRAPSWYPEWCQRHAIHFGFRSPDDPAVMAAWWDLFSLEGYTQLELDEVTLWATRQKFGAMLPRTDHRLKLAARIASVRHARRQQETLEQARSRPAEPEVPYVPMAERFRKLQGPDHDTATPTVQAQTGDDGG